MAAPVNLLTKAALSRLSQRAPLSDYLVEKNAADARRVVFATNLSSEAGDAQDRAFQSLPKKRVEMMDFLLDWNAAFRATSHEENVPTEREDGPAKDKPEVVG